MCRDPSHATAEVWRYFFLAILAVNKMQILKRFSPPQANNMEAIWLPLAEGISPGKLYTWLSTKKSVWRASFMSFHAEKDPGLNFCRNYTLNPINFLPAICVRFVSVVIFWIYVCCLWGISREQVPNCWLVSPNHGGRSSGHMIIPTAIWGHLVAPCLPQMMWLLCFWTPWLRLRIAAWTQRCELWILNLRSFLFAVTMMCI